MEATILADAGTVDPLREPIVVVGVAAWTRDVRSVRWLFFDNTNPKLTAWTTILSTLVEGAKTPFSADKRLPTDAQKIHLALPTGWGKT
jgi:hypothetical protein